MIPVSLKPAWKYWALQHVSQPGSYKNLTSAVFIAVPLNTYTQLKCRHGFACLFPLPFCKTLIFFFLGKMSGYSTTIPTDQLHFASAVLQLQAAKFFGWLFPHSLLWGLVSRWAVKQLWHFCQNWHYFSSGWLYTHYTVYYRVGPRYSGTD